MLLVLFKVGVAVLLALEVETIGTAVLLLVLEV